MLEKDSSIRKRLRAIKLTVGKHWRNGRRRFFATLDAVGERHGSVAVISHALEDFFEHRMTLHSGNFAYSAFLSIFPLVLTILAVVGFIFRYNPSVLQGTIDYLRKMMPDFGRGTIMSATDSVSNLRNLVGVVGILGLLWSVSRISYSLDSGFERIWETGKTSYFRKKAFAFLVLLLLGGLLMVALGVTFVSSQALGWIDAHTGPLLSGVAAVLGVLLGPALTFLMFAAVYRVLPRKKPGYREIFWGALVAALLFDASEYVLSFYWTGISKQQALYGSLGVVLGIVLWMYLLGILIFFGAEIVHVMQERRGEVPVEELPQLSLPGLETD